MRVGIVGGGPAGCAAATAMHSNAEAWKIDVESYIIDTNPHYGGRSFQVGNPALVLNTSAGVTSVDADKPKDFTNFLRRYRSADDSEFASRAEAAQYLKHSIQNATGPHSSTHIIRGSVAGVFDISETSIAVGVNRKPMEFDALILATGAPFKSLQASGIGSHKSPYWLNIDADIETDSPVVIIGSSLSAIDACVTLHSIGHKGPICVISKSGRLPAVRNSVLHSDEGSEFEDAIAHRSSNSKDSQLRLLKPLIAERIGGTLAAALHEQSDLDGAQEFLQAYEECESSETRWEQLIMSIVDTLNRNWPRANAEERRTFHQTTGYELNRFVSAMPLNSARILQEMMAGGQLRLLKGALDRSGFPRLADGSHLPLDLQRVITVNATGLGRPINEKFISELQHHGIISANSEGGIKVSKTGAASDKYPVYALGPATIGNIYTSNFLYSSAQTARLLVKDLFASGSQRMKLKV